MLCGYIFKKTPILESYVYPFVLFECFYFQ